MGGYAKPESGRANDSRPFGTIEMLAQETERLRHVIPGELGNLKSTNSFSLVADQPSDRKPELSRLNAPNHSAWKVSGQGSIVRGLLGVGFRFGTKAGNSGAKRQPAGMNLIPGRRSAHSRAVR